MACSANRLGPNRTGLRRVLTSGMRFSTVTPSFRQKASKSFSERQWMFGVSYQPKGNCDVTGALPVSRSWSRQRQYAKFGKLTMTLRPTRKSSPKTISGSLIVCTVCERMT